MTISNDIPNEVALLSLKIEINAIKSYFDKTNQDLQAVVGNILQFNQEGENINQDNLSEIQNLLKKAEELSKAVQGKWKCILALRKKAGNLNVPYECEDQILGLGDMFADLLLISFAAISNLKKILARLSCLQCGSAKIVNDGEGDIDCLECGAQRCV